MSKLPDQRADHPRRARLCVDAGAALLVFVGIFAVAAALPTTAGFAVLAGGIAGVVTLVCGVVWLALRGAEWLGDQLAARGRARARARLHAAPPGQHDDGRIAAAAADAAAAIDRAAARRRGRAVTSCTGGDQ